MKITSGNRGPAWALLLVALLITTGCKPEESDESTRPAVAGSPGETFLLETDELKRITRQAESGDVVAMLVLVRHYERDHKKEEVERWLRAAVAKGDISAMQNLAVFVTLQADKAKCVEAEALLQRAIGLAKDPAQRNDVEQTLEVLRMGFRGQGDCVAWLNAQKAA